MDDVARAMMLSAMREADENGGRNLGTPQAQAMELQDRFFRYQVEHGFRPGQIVREKPGLCMLPHSTGRVLIFWRWLDVSDRIDWELIKDCVRCICLNTVDCMVAYKMDDGTGLMFMLHEARRLEPADYSN